MSRQYIWASLTCVCLIKVLQIYNEATSKFHSFIQGLCGVNFSWHWYGSRRMTNDFRRHGTRLWALLYVKLVFNNLFILISHALKCQRSLRLLRLTKIALQIWFGFSSAVSVCIYTYTLIIPSSSWIFFFSSRFVSAHEYKATITSGCITY